MSDEDRKPALVALRQRRQEVIDRLTDDFARDLIEVDEFEMRVDQAHRAPSIEALEKVVADLAPLEATAQPISPERAMELHPSRTPATALATNRAERRWAVAVMGGVERKGSWRVPHTLRVVCVMGGAEIDFREVDLPPGVTQVKIVCMMGGAEIIVPPGSGRSALARERLRLHGRLHHLDAPARRERAPGQQAPAPRAARDGAPPAGQRQVSPR
jgi:Domain of unknown function (DUF1707)